MPFGSSLSRMSEGDNNRRHQTIGHTEAAGKTDRIEIAHPARAESEVGGGKAYVLGDDGAVYVYMAVTVACAHPPFGRIA